MLKSAVLFTRVKLDVHIFIDDHLQSEFRNMVSKTKTRLAPVLKAIFTNVPYHVLVARLTLMALF